MSTDHKSKALINFEDHAYYTLTGGEHFACDKKI